MVGSGPAWCAGINGVGAGATALAREARITVERGRIVIATVDPHGLGGIGNVENDHAFVAVGHVEPIIVLLDLMAGDHLIAAVRILTVAFRIGLADVLADDVEARDELRLGRRVVVEDVELLDLGVLLRFGRGTAHIDVAVVHLHAVGEAACVAPLTEELRVARVGHVVERHARDERLPGGGLSGLDDTGLAPVRLFGCSPLWSNARIWRAQLTRR